MTGAYLRYVALGDSQTEGMNDGDEVRGYRGWADRLAVQLAAADPRVHYANLAVRGRLTQEVHAEQLPVALSLRPDLVTVLAGMNDLLRPRFDAAEVAGHQERMVAALTGLGAHVVTFALPDPSVLVPAARGLAKRAQDLNAHVREAAGRHGATVVDLSAHPVCTDARLWSPDRLHLNTLGHTRLAAAVGHALDLPGNDPQWMSPLAPQRRPAAWRRAVGEAHWVASFVGPWLLRRLRGRSSGDGRTAKRPALAPVEENL
ncbi:SGNH/GDSL hydrolase family protein [Actinoplanes sp. ATCC 53533]|uniref:SGNH/GDSL hydrolase family protein n=1 Tax=Actinoplanes sp. ATCC 53533 TaxID=1288362 RepID=UPI001F45D0D7|nr:SGNH/GDSL hydrolase family protein [Actinoplanes sp. ATCC 53533]